MSQGIGYDIIGDIHGCAQTLELLLDRLGYRKLGGIYQHPKRQAVFVGDIIDRGPRIRESVLIVRDMVDRGHAHIVLGNHEYNALGYCTEVPGKEGSGYVRTHIPHHDRLISETLNQFANHSQDWKDILNWFMDIPLFMELPGFRVVHACWDNDLIESFKQTYDRNCLNYELLLESSDKSSLVGMVLDRLTRGTDLKLPKGQVVRSRDGFERRYFRTKFWSSSPKVYRDVVFQPDPIPEHIADSKITDKDRSRLLSYPEYHPPVFVGHYWLQGRPKPLRHNVACLDYSAVKYGRLVAYRFDGEEQLDSNKFVWVYVDP